MSLFFDLKMSFLENDNIKEEIKQKEDEINDMRKERRKHLLNYSDNLKLCFSMDLIQIPYCDDDEHTYLIDGTKAYEIEGVLNIKFNEFVCDKEFMDYEHIHFYRDRTSEEDKFMTDYNKLINYKTINSIDKYIPKSNKPFTINIINKLKQVLKQELIKKKKQEKEQKINEYNAEQSEKRLTGLIDNYDYNKEINKINQDYQKELKKKDIEFNPDLYEKHQQQLKPKSKLDRTVNFKMINGGYPYRSYSKLKSLYDDFDKDKYNKQIKHYNNYNVKDNKQKYSLKTYSNVKNSFIGDIFFESNKAAFLLLININTRYAYAYKLGDYDIKEVINVDENIKEYTMKYATKGKKTTTELKKAFDKFIKNHSINVLRFDGERAIGSEEFKQYLNDHHIKFIPAIPNVHTSLSLIDRLCRTIRDIAFNLNYEYIYLQKQMDIILNFYNHSRHETLTQTLFKAYPELKETYKFISPYIMENNDDNLENLFVKECIKYNYYIKSKPDYKIDDKEDIKVVNDNSKLQKKRTILSKDNYKITNKFGNIFEVKNTRTNESLFKPRYQIKQIKKSKPKPEYYIFNELF